jgi:hypothetical protein
MGVVLGPIVSMPTIFSALTGIFTVVLICIFTRFSTGSRSKQGGTGGGAQKISTIPYWLPWLGHTWSFATGGQQFLSRSSREYKLGAFAIILRGQKYTILTAPSLAGQLEDTDGLDLSSEVRQYKLRNFFGNRTSGSSSKETLACYNTDRTMLAGRSGILRTQKHIKKLVGALERTVYNLISFNESWIDQSSWERASKTIVDINSNAVAEVSFFALIEHYIGEVSTTALLGRNFLENNPDFLDDLRLWNSKGTSFMKQVPLFLPRMSAAAAARERVLRSLRRFRGTLSAYTAGDDPGSGWSDLSDVSALFTERVIPLEHEGKPASTTPDVSVDAALIWAFNKPSTIIAWLLYRVYSDSALLAEVRKDINPFVHVEYVKSELPIHEPPLVKIDAEGLVKESKLLRAVIDETIHLHTSTITYGVAAEDLILKESDEDAAILWKSKPDSYIIRKGELVCITSQAGERDGGYGKGTFNPAGFNSLANLKVPSATAVSKSHVNHAWGVGRVSCPGKDLAEHEILVIAAVFLSMWEVDCKWQWPGQQPGLCSSLPLEDIRVKVSRRKTENEVE